MHDGQPTAFGYVNTFTAHVNVGFFLSAELTDPNGLLEGTGKLNPSQAIDEAALHRIILAAYTQMRKRLEVASHERVPGEQRA